MKRAILAAALAVFFVSLAPGAGAQVAISALPAASTPTGSEILPIVQSGVTSKATISQLSAPLLAATNTWSGANTFTSSTVAPGYALGGNALTSAPASGVMLLTNGAGTDFVRLQFGGTSSAFPALRRSGNTLDVRTADDSTSAALTASVLVATSYIRTLPLTVSTLPSASATGAGSRAFVSDANATTFNSVVAGGGSNSVPVFSDGTNWRIG